VFNLQCSVFSLQVFLFAVCSYKCIQKLEADSVKGEAGGGTSNSAWVIQFHSDSIPDPLPVRTLALQLLCTSS
jgi:hypothetical protein